MFKFRSTAETKLRSCRKLLSRERKNRPRTPSFFFAIFFHVLLLDHHLLLSIYKCKNQTPKGKRYSTKPQADLEKSKGKKEMFSTPD
jgi:hypothetical protein